MKFIFCKLLISCILLTAIISNKAYSQENPGVSKLIEKTESYFEKMPSEKLYLHFDKPYYTTGDTIWLKAYLFNSSDYTASKMSNKVYVELINDSNRVVIRFAVPLLSGLGRGNLILDDVRDGQYTIRAYTNWMQNFGEELFFTKSLYIGTASPKLNWLINEQQTVRSIPSGNETNMVMQLTDLTKMPIAYRDVEVKVMEDKKTVYRGSYVTSDGGNLTAKFLAPLKAKDHKLTVWLTDKVTKNKLAFPLVSNSVVQNIDLQFMPEGGKILAGLPGKVAFKAIGDDGLGIDVKGEILNSSNEIVADFQSAYQGMGSFTLSPVAGQNYRARINLNSAKKDFNLPAINSSGISLRVDNLSNTDSIFLYLRATADVIIDKTYKLIAHGRDGIYFGATFNMHDGYCNIRLAKSRFPSGIISFTVLDGITPLCERRIFIDHHNRLQINIISNKPHFGPKDSVAVNFTVCDVQGKPILGNFSVSVTDDNYVKGDIYTDNITTRLLLTSELKGHIEKPFWYFMENTKLKQLALDNLMLTQGWTGYDFGASLQPVLPPRFDAEPENRLTGTLRRLFNRPQKGAKINMFSLSKKHGLMVFDTVSNAAGEFVFDKLPMLDTVAYTVKVTNSKGNESTATITLNDFKPAKVGTLNNTRQMPWYMRTNDTLMLNYFNRPQPLPLKGIDQRDIKGTLLKEVVIKGRKVITQGKYTGNVLKEVDEKDLVKAGKLSLLDVIVAKEKQFGLSTAWRTHVFARLAFYSYSNYTIGPALVADVIVDGNSAQEMFGIRQTGSNETYREFLSGFLRNLGADDIKNIKIMEERTLFITITTRSGQGLFSQSSPGIVFYRPVSLCPVFEFYRPRYSVKNSNPVPARPTIHWEPNLVTDHNGNATVSFYAADKPSTYTINIEGTNMQGGFGYKTGKISITSQTETKAKPAK